MILECMKIVLEQNISRFKENQMLIESFKNRIYTRLSKH